jgi:PAS domain S-box-containing protein
MCPLQHYQRFFRWFVLFGGCAIFAVWFSVFPLNPPFDMEDVLYEVLILGAIVLAYLLTIRLKNPILEAGFGLYVIAFLIDFFDEFTKEPGIVNTQLEGILKILALALIVAGLHLAYRGFEENLSHARAREEALQKSEEKYKNLIEHIGEVVCEVDSRGKITYISPQVTGLLGFSPGDLIGRDFASLSEPVSREDFTSYLKGMLAAGQPVTLYEHAMLRSDGKPVTVQSSGTPFFTDGTLKGYRFVSRDISGQMRAEEALRQANVKLNLLSSITRHDVLNQLTIIIGLLEILKDRISDTDILSLMEKERLAAEKIHDLINFTRDYQDIGIRSPKWQTVADIAKKSVRNLDLGAVSNDIRLDDLQIYADPLLEKVFYTLYENTLRHGGEVRTISLSFREENGGAVIVYEDDGTGIPDDEKNLIFNREYGKNTGYGLFLATEILSITGIAMTETGSFGAGSRFELHVPAGAFRAGNLEKK